jgi:hypothetical protein
MRHVLVNLGAHAAACRRHTHRPAHAGDWAAGDGADGGDGGDASIAGVVLIHQVTRLENDKTSHSVLSSGRPVARYSRAPKHAARSASVRETPAPRHAVQDLVPLGSFLNSISPNLAMGVRGLAMSKRATLGRRDWTSRPVDPRLYVGEPKLEVATNTDADRPTAGLNRHGFDAV